MLGEYGKAGAWGWTLQVVGERRHTVFCREVRKRPFMGRRRGRAAAGNGAWGSMRMARLELQQCG